MKANFRVADPDNIECTMALTMTLRNWKKLLDAFGTTATHYPMYRLTDTIRALVTHTSDHFDYEKPEGIDVKD